MNTETDQYETVNNVENELLYILRKLDIKSNSTWTEVIGVTVLLLLNWQLLKLNHLSKVLRLQVLVKPATMKLDES